MAPPARRAPNLATAPIFDGPGTSQGLRRGHREIVGLLDQDPDLQTGLGTGPELDAARRHARAVVYEVSPPAFKTAMIDAYPRTGWLGLLLLDGLLVRHVQLGRRASCELCGPGDLLRPWDPDGVHDPLMITVEWQILKPTRLAVLDTDFTRRTARWPSIHSQLTARVAQRARDLALTQAVTQFPTAHTRLLILFWLLAQRFGKVTPDGVLITLPVTHKLLGMMIGTQRPTVTLALRRLARADHLVREDRQHWLLSSTGIESLNRHSLQPIDDALVLSS